MRESTPSRRGSTPQTLSKMKLCIPIDEDNGLKSETSLLFASAKHFIVIDPETMNYQVIDNPDPLKDADPAKTVNQLCEHAVTHVIVGGIGRDALTELQESNIQVYTSEKDQVEEIVDAFKNDEVTPVILGHSCERRGPTRGFQGPGGCTKAQGPGGCRGNG